MHLLGPVFLTLALAAVALLIAAAVAGKADGIRQDARDGGEL